MKKFTFIGVFSCLLSNALYATPVPAIPIPVEISHTDLVMKDKRFEKLLLGSPDLLEFGGVRLGKGSKGETLILAVGYTTIKNSSPTDKVRQITVSKQKAKAALVGFLEGEYVQSMTKFQENLSLKSTKEKDMIEMRSLFNETILSKIKGRIGSGLERIAFWKSADGLAFYQAVGFALE